MQILIYENQFGNVQHHLIILSNILMKVTLNFKSYACLFLKLFIAIFPNSPSSIGIKKSASIMGGHHHLYWLKLICWISDAFKGKNENEIWNLGHMLAIQACEHMTCHLMWRS